jgi:hypothetical protein
MTINLSMQGGEESAFTTVVDKNGYKKMLTGAY